MMMQKDEYLARGRRWRSRLVGYSQARYPALRSLTRPKEIVLYDGRTEVEHAAQPLVVIVYQADVLLDAHHTGIRQGCFCFMSNESTGNEAEAILSR